MRLDLAEDPAVIGVAADLGLDEDSVVGKLHRLWSWASKVSRDGHAASVTKTWLDRYVGATGFAEAVAKHGWLMLIDGGGIRIPNWEHWLSQSAKARLQAALRQAKHRAIVTEMSRCERDKNVTTVQKSREENNTDGTCKEDSPPSDLFESIRDASSADADGLSNGKPRQPRWAAEAFAEWWAAYPRKVGKRKSEDAWLASVRRLESEGQARVDAIAYLLSACQAFARSPSGQAGEFCPHPATWLNQGRYDDDRKTWQIARTKHGRPERDQNGPALNFDPNAVSDLA